MLKISRLTDYATVVMAYLSKRRDHIHNAKEITDYTKIALPTVSKLLKLLAKANLLTSHRGANGGYSLTRKPEDISIANIIQAIEGDVGLTECSHLDGQCNIEDICDIRGNWRYISQIIIRALEDVSLAEMANSATTHRVSLSDLKQQLSYGETSMIEKQEK